MRRYRLEYTNIYDRSRRSREIKAYDEEDAKLWFENHLDRDNLLDGVIELERV